MAVLCYLLSLLVVKWCSNDRKRGEELLDYVCVIHLKLIMSTLNQS